MRWWTRAFRVAFPGMVLLGWAFGMILLAQDGESVETPEDLSVCQLDYGAEGTLRLRWTSPQTYDEVEVEVDGKPAAVAAAGADSTTVVTAAVGSRSLAVRGVLGGVPSTWATAQFDVLSQSPLPRPIAGLDCEIFPFEGGRLIVRWTSGQDAWVSGLLEIPRSKRSVAIEQGATEASIDLDPDDGSAGGPQVVRLTFQSAESYTSPPFTPLCTPRVPRFRRGDCNGSGHVNITDPIYELMHLFRGGSRWFCDDACDANDDGDINISDPIATLMYLFAGAGPLPAPGPTECGVDPTEDLLGGLCSCQ